jgi:hypothetical protein
MKFIKYDNFWWQWHDEVSTLDKAEISRPYYDPIIVNATKFEMVEVEKFDDLKWYGTNLYDNKYDTGWLDRSGKFYGCAYEYHEEQAAFVHKMSEEKLEEKGFIKITRDVNLNSLIAYFSGDSYDKNMRPTKAQENYLHKLEKEKNCVVWFSFVSDELDEDFEPSN